MPLQIRSGTFESGPVVTGVALVFFQLTSEFHELFA
jgi:hypothetical protein